MPHSIFITKTGGPEVLKLREVPFQPLQPKEVRIAVAAAGINFADLMMRQGLYPEAPPTPFIPGYEIAGKIIEIGTQVSKLKIGDRVLAGCKFGGYTTEFVAEESNTFHTPAALSDAEAAAIPVNFLTAWFALSEMGRVRKGDRVLVQSAAGGVGIAAVQLASRAGAHVVGTVGSQAKMQVVRDLGASEVILNSAWESGSDADLGGFDLILDAVGGKSFKRSFRRLGPSGRIICYGVSAAVGQKKSLPKILSTLVGTPIYTPFQLMNSNRGIFGLNLLKYFEPTHQSKLLAAMSEIMSQFERRELKVLVGKTFPLSEAGAAQDYLQSRSNVGKVILAPS